MIRKKKADALKKTPIIGYHNEEFPIIAAYWEDGQLTFWCSYCQRNHLHGWGDGHRVAHCDEDNPLKENGYILKTMSKEEVFEIFPENKTKEKKKKKN